MSPLTEWPHELRSPEKCTAAQRWSVLLGRQEAVLKLLGDATTPTDADTLAAVKQLCEEDATGYTLAACISITALPLPVAGCRGETSSAWFNSTAAALHFVGDVVPELRTDGSGSQEEFKALAAKWRELVAALSSCHGCGGASQW